MLGGLALHPLVADGSHSPLFSPACFDSGGNLKPREGDGLAQGHSGPLSKGFFILVDWEDWTKSWCMRYRKRMKEIFFSLPSRKEYLPLGPEDGIKAALLVPFSLSRREALKHLGVKKRPVGTQNARGAEGLRSGRIGLWFPHYGKFPRGLCLCIYICLCLFPPSQSVFFFFS